MAVIGWILFSFAVVRLAVALVNYFMRPYLPPAPAGQGRGRVSVLVPARNEKENIPVLLDGFRRWRDEVCELIVYDDQSTDDTAAIVAAHAATDPKIRLVAGGPLPPGWLGKNHACDRLARAASGDKLLFLDADVTLSPGTVAAAAGFLDREGVKLLSVFPTQVIDNPGARLGVPLMNWILLSLLPLPAVRLAPQESLAAANGQFMMFDAATYRSLVPHSRLRDSPVEDIATIQLYKAGRQPVATLLGGDNVFCRMYGDLRGSIEGFSRNIFAFFGGSPILTWLFVIALTMAPFWIFVYNGPVAGAVYLVLVILIRVFVSAASKQSVAANVLLMIPQHIVLWVIILKATFKRKKLQWKGRNI